MSPTPPTSSPGPNSPTSPTPVVAAATKSPPSLDSVTSPSSRHSSLSNGSVSKANPFPAHTEVDIDGGDNHSAFSTHTLRTLRNGYEGEDDEDDGGTTPHVIHVEPREGQEIEDTQAKATSIERRRTIVRAFSQLAILFVVCAVVMGGTLYFALPTLDEQDKPDFKVPKNFDQLKALNAVLQRYKDENYGRVMLCWITVYMFLQAFSIPGSMYMSILAGAMWGVPVALPIVCASVATGATICYLISMFLGEVLVAIPSWKARVDGWKEVLDRQRDDMLSYLIVIRMMPLPPHNVVNILAPHLGIKIPLFWISTFFGIFAVSVIHTTIGEKLDQMTSPADFNLFTVRNALLLGGVCIAVMIPVVLRKRSAAASNPLEESTPAVGRIRLEGPEGGPFEAHRDSPTHRDRALRTFRGEGAADDDDELPPVRMRGAIAAGFDRRRSAEHGDAGDDDVYDEEYDNDYDGYLLDEEDADVRPSRASMDAEELSPESVSSLRGFHDRREQARGRTGSNGGSAGTNGSRRHGERKIVRVLGSECPEDVADEDARRGPPPKREESNTLSNLWRGLASGFGGSRNSGRRGSS